MKTVWARQLDAGLRDVTVGGTHFEWVASESWAQEIVSLTRGEWGAEAAEGYASGATKTPTAKVRPWVENPKAKPWVDSAVFRFADRVNKTTAEDLRKALAGALERHETPDKFKDAVAEVFRGYVQEQRAEMIARTELSRALNGGTLLAWKESGQVAAKEWDAANDACPFCLAMDGRVMELDRAYFEEGDVFTVEWNGKDRRLGMNYGAVHAPPLHPNCRCTLVPVLSGTPKAEALRTRPPQKPPTTQAPAPAAPSPTTVPDFPPGLNARQLGEWAEANIRGCNFCNLAGMTIKDREDVVRAASQISSRYLVDVPRIGTPEDFGEPRYHPNALMTANHKGVRILPENWTQSAMEWLANSDHSVNAKDARGIIFHELGHVAQFQPRTLLGARLTWQDGINILRPIVDRYRAQMGRDAVIRELGRYAWTGVQDGNAWMETWAEAFSAYHTNPSALSAETRVMIERGLRILFPDLLLPPIP